MNVVIATRWYAISNSSNCVIAEGDSYLECSDAAARASGWDRAPGIVAPYFLTTDRWFADQFESAGD